MEGRDKLEQAVRSRPTWSFEATSDQWLHDNLAELVSRLESLDGPDVHGCTRAAVQSRISRARSLAQRSLVTPADAWREAIAAIANPATDPAYEGLKIQPVLGLVPLGRDPKSHLWEFAHVLSGETPARDRRRQSRDGNRVRRSCSCSCRAGRPSWARAVRWRTSGRLADHLDPQAQSREGPPHEVTLDPYLLSKYEMTQGQWLRLTGSNPSFARSDRAFEHGYRPGLLQPVEQVSFEDCADVLWRHGLALPTEAQWERAARAGTTTPWWPGETIESFFYDREPLGSQVRRGPPDDVTVRRRARRWLGRIGPGRNLRGQPVRVPRRHRQRPGVVRRSDRKLPDSRAAGRRTARRRLSRMAHGPRRILPVDRGERTIVDALRHARLGQDRHRRSAPRARSPEAMSAGAVTTLGRYRLIRELGRGGEATVHLAEDPALKRVVALKVFPPSIGVESAEVPAGWLNEVEVLSRLDHPGICNIHDAGVEDGCAFIAMSYVEGRTLAERPGTDVDKAVRIAAEVADTLTAAHAVGIVHGDLKPANILVTRDGRPVLLDFGVAGFLDTSGRRRSGRIAGTLPYLAPERLASGPDVSADVFGLGAVLFELVAGITPFSAPTQAALVGRIEREHPPLLRALVPGASSDLEAVLAKAVDRNPSARYPTMGAFASDLRRLVAGERVSARRYGPVARAARWARRRKALAALLVFAAAFLAIAATVTVVKNADLHESLEQSGIQAHRATSAARAAEDSLVRYERLADRRRLQVLEARAARLVPPTAAIAPALQAWLDEARALVDRLDEHRRALTEVRARGRPASNAAPPSRSGCLARDVASLRSRLGGLDSTAPGKPRLAGLIEKLEESLPRPKPQASYEDPADSGHDETLGTLIEDLERFADPDRFKGTMADVAHRLDEIRTIEEAAAKSAALWDAAASSIANEAECPRYCGLRVKPQPGLVPLGRNPASGLWEFLHVLTGDAPREDSSGRTLVESGTGIVLVLLPGGITRMGARRPREGEPAETPHVDALAVEAESPIDDIPLDPHFVSKFEMTQAQWIRIRGVLPASLDREKGVPVREGTTLPVIAVNWFEAQSALARVGLGLPTEAQWEHAARGGTTTPWPTGQDPSALATTAVFGMTSVEPVGLRQPNAFGLHDLIGNAAEWCLDVFARYDDPRLEGTGERFGLDETEHRIFRGGSISSSPSILRSARRDLQVPAYRSIEMGVRPARILDR